MSSMLLVAACSSSSKSTSSPTTAAPSGSSGSSSTSGSSGSSSGSGGTPTGTPYVIGNIGTYSGPYASSSVGAKDALTAWMKYTNAHGGINGHPVQVIIKDDQASSSLVLSEARELVNQNHILALVGSESITQETWEPYFSSVNVPVIGDQLASDTFTKHPNIYPQGATQATSYFYGLPKVAAMQGKTTFGAIYCAETSACQQIANSQKQEASAAGVKVVFGASASASAPSYTAQCLSAKGSGANAIALLLSEQVASLVAAACEQQGYHPLFLQSANGFTQGETSDSALDGVVGSTPDFPWFASSNPAEQAFQSAMRQYNPQDFTSSATNGYSEGTAMAWSAAQIFAAAAATLPAGTPTPAKVIDALHNLPKGDTFGGLTPPISYVSSGPQPQVNCFFAIQLSNGKYSELNNGQPICKP